MCLVKLLETFLDGLRDLFRAFPPISLVVLDHVEVFMALALFHAIEEIAGGEITLLDVLVFHPLRPIFQINSDIMQDLLTLVHDYICFA